MSLAEDARHTLRTVAQSPGWSAVTLLSLAVGIGANVALFAHVDWLLLRDLPAVARPEELVRLRSTGEAAGLTWRSDYGYSAPAAGGQRVFSTFSYPMFEGLAEANRTLEGLFACAPVPGDAVVVANGHADSASALLVSGGYFDLLGVSAGLGRTLSAEDDAPSAVPVAVISHGFWSSRFGLDPEVVGEVVSVNGVPVTVVGVLTRDYRGVQYPLAHPPDLHLPLAHAPRLSEVESLDRASTWWLQIMGRLRPGATPEQVVGNLGGVFRAAAPGEGETAQGARAAEQPGGEGGEPRLPPRLLVDSGRRGIYDPPPAHVRQVGILGGVVALLLAVVCANIAMLMLARVTRRRREIAIRLSLGATRGRIARLLGTEALVLAAVGGGLGLVVARLVGALLPFGESVSLDWRVLAVAAVLSVAAAFASSLVPAMRAARRDVWHALGETTATVARSRTFLGRTLMVAQVAVSLVLIAGAGLFLATLENLRSVDVGLDPDRILLFELDPQRSGYQAGEVPALYERVADAVRALPGVRGVALSDMPVLSGWMSISSVYLEGVEETADSPHDMTVSPEYFEVTGIPLLAGRGFGPRDDADAPRVAVVSRTAALEWFGGESPLGRRLGFNPADRGAIEIVGIVGDVKLAGVREAAPPVLYRAHAQEPMGGRVVTVKTLGPPAALTPAVREAVRSVDDALPLLRVATQRERIEGRFADERSLATAYSLFGGIAALLASIGLFGLASYDVAQRTREIGVRMALGAEAWAVTRMVMGQSLVLVGLGLAVGVGLALAAGRMVESLLFGLAPWDLAALASASGLLLAVGILAALLPARRAAGVDPVLALRSE